MEGGFRGRQSEEQPTMASIHGFEAEHIPEERAIGLGVLAADDYVCAKDHCPPSSERS
jgi:hypothetical protein